MTMYKIISTLIKDIDQQTESDLLPLKSYFEKLLSVTLVREQVFEQVFKTRTVSVEDRNKVNLDEISTCIKDNQTQIEQGSGETFYTLVVRDFELIQASVANDVRLNDALKDAWVLAKRDKKELEFIYDLVSGGMRTEEQGQDVQCGSNLTIAMNQAIARVKNGIDGSKPFTFLDWIKQTLQLYREGILDQYYNVHFNKGENRTVYGRFIAYVHEEFNTRNVSGQPRSKGNDVGFNLKEIKTYFNRFYTLAYIVDRLNEQLVTLLKMSNNTLDTDDEKKQAKDVERSYAQFVRENKAVFSNEDDVEAFKKAYGVDLIIDCPENGYELIRISYQLWIDILLKLNIFSSSSDPVEIKIDKESMQDSAFTLLQANTITLKQLISTVNELVPNNTLIDSDVLLKWWDTTDVSSDLKDDLGKEILDKILFGGVCATSIKENMVLIQKVSQTSHTTQIQVLNKLEVVFTESISQLDVIKQGLNVLNEIVKGNRAIRKRVFEMFSDKLMTLIKTPECILKNDVIETLCEIFKDMNHDIQQKYFDENKTQLVLWLGSDDSRLRQSTLTLLDALTFQSDYRCLDLEVIESRTNTQKDFLTQYDLSLVSEKSTFNVDGLNVILIFSKNNPDICSHIFKSYRSQIHGFLSLETQNEGQELALDLLLSLNKTSNLYKQVVVEFELEIKSQILAGHPTWFNALLCANHKDVLPEIKVDVFNVYRETFLSVLLSNSSSSMKEHAFHTLSTMIESTSFSIEIVDNYGNMLIESLSNEESSNTLKIAALKVIGSLCAGELLEQHLYIFTEQLKQILDGDDNALKYEVLLVLGSYIDSKNVDTINFIIEEFGDRLIYFAQATINNDDNCNVKETFIKLVHQLLSIFQKNTSDPNLSQPCDRLEPTMHHLEFFGKYFKALNSSNNRENHITDDMHDYHFIRNIVESVSESADSIKDFFLLNASTILGELVCYARGYDRQKIFEYINNLITDTSNKDVFLEQVCPYIVRTFKEHHSNKFIDREIRLGTIKILETLSQHTDDEFNTKITNQFGELLFLSVNENPSHVRSRIMDLSIRLKINHKLSEIIPRIWQNIGDYCLNNIDYMQIYTPIYLRAFQPSLFGYPQKIRALKMLGSQKGQLLHASKFKLNETNVRNVLTNGTLTQNDLSDLVLYIHLLQKKGKFDKARMIETEVIRVLSEHVAGNE